MNAAPTSVRRRLLMALISSILLVWIVVLVLVYRAAQHEVEEVFDADLSRSARILQTLLLHEVSEEQEMQEKVRAAIDELGSDGLRRYPTLSANLRGYLEDQVQERLDLLMSRRQTNQLHVHTSHKISRIGIGCRLQSRRFQSVKNEMIDG